MKGKYIVIEGQDGTGKSTQVQLLADYYKKKGVEVITFDEPGGMPSADMMRKIIKNKDLELDGSTIFLLFTAARRELWTKLGQPIIERGGIVIAARSWWSSLTYQCCGQGVPKKLIEQITTNVMPKRYVTPDVGIILTLSDAERSKRMLNRDGENSKKDTFESKADDFQMRVNNGYIEVAKEKNATIIDASPSPEEIHQQIIKLL